MYSKDDLTSDVSRFHSEKQKQQIEYLSELGTENIAAIKISPEEQPLPDHLVDETTEGHGVLGSNSESDEARLALSESTVDQQQESLIEEAPSAPLVVLAFSCVAAFMALACVVVTLYIIKSFRSQVLASKTAWGLLPRFWSRPRSEENASATAEQRVSGGSCLLLQTDHLLDAEEGSAQRHDPPLGDKPLYYDAVSDMESEWDDADEKYQDALDMTPLPFIHDLPLEDNVSHPSHFDDPPLPSLSHPLDQPTVDRSTPLMRELCSSPVARPAWSVRAIDAPPLGLSSCQAGVDATPQALVHPRRRAYRSPVPDFDIALAMQLRPGLGIGADSAWMVRFLMAMFGWFAVALTGNAR